MANGEKSSILFFKNVGGGTKRIIREVLGFKESKADSIYLGNAFVFWRNKSKEFGRLKERVQSKLEGWRSQTLSKFGKATLIKSVVQAIPAYTMSTFKVHLGVCKD